MKRFYFVALSLVYTALATVRLRYPGLHFDEMLHVNAALGGLDNTFMYKTLAGVPVLLMPYIGALKAWLTGPIFAIFGVSVMSIRLPLILLTAAALYLLGRTLQRWIGFWPAVAVCALLAVDPTLISLTRADSGPIALQFALTVCALACLGSYVRTRGLLALVGLVASLGLGVFNKLNFIWIANAFVAGFLLVYARSILIRSKKLLHPAIFFGGYGLAAAYYLVASYKFNLFDFLSPEKFNWTARFANVSTSLSSIVRGDLFYNYALGELHLTAASVVLWIIMAIGLAGVVLVLVGAPLFSRTERRLGIFALIVGSTTFIQLCITRNAVWPWHFATLYPALHIVFVLGLLGCYRWFKKTRSKRAPYIAAVPLVLLMSTYIATNCFYFAALGRPTKNVYWSPAVYELIETTRNDPYRYVSIDWGTHTQLLGFSQDPEKFQNASFFINRDPLPSTAKEEFKRRFLSDSGHKTRFILHSPQATLFPAARKNFFVLVGGPEVVQPVQTIANGDQPLFEIYQLR